MTDNDLKKDPAGGMDEAQDEAPLEHPEEPVSQGLRRKRVLRPRNTVLRNRAHCCVPRDRGGSQRQPRDLLLRCRSHDARSRPIDRQARERPARVRRAVDI